MSVNIKTPGPMNVKLARVASITNVAAITASGVLFLENFDGAGFVALFITLVSFVGLIGTGVYRIIGGKPLDEFETNMARKAYQCSYLILGAGLMIGVFMAHITNMGSDLTELRSILEFSVWAVIDVVIVLPVAVLAWLMPTVEIGFED